jgi:D-alanine-D-alanine ligase
VRIVLLHSADALEPPVDPVIEQIASVLREDHEVSCVSVGAQVAPVVSELLRAGPELVFNIAESFAGRSALEAGVAGLLDLLNLPHTGSSFAGLMLAGDKSLAKKVLRFHDVSTPDFATVYRGAVDWADDIDFPVMVKPVEEDGSIGITSASVVYDLRELFDRIDALQTEFNQPVLVEKFVEGREFYVGVLGNADPHVLPVMELDFSGLPAGTPRIASWDAKWGADGSGAGAGAEQSAEFRGTKSVFPTDLEGDLAERLRHVAAEAFAALRLRDYARIDVRVSRDGEIYVIEVNPNCYLERTAEFASAAERDGMEYPALIKRIVELASARHAVHAG